MLISAAWCAAGLDQNHRTLLDRRQRLALARHTRRHDGASSFFLCSLQLLCVRVNPRHAGVGQHALQRLNRQRRCLDHSADRCWRFGRCRHDGSLSSFHCRRSGHHGRFDRLYGRHSGHRCHGFCRAHGLMHHRGSCLDRRERGCLHRLGHGRVQNRLGGLATFGSCMHVGFCSSVFAVFSFAFARARLLRPHGHGDSGCDHGDHGGGALRHHRCLPRLEPSLLRQ